MINRQQSIQFVVCRDAWRAGNEPALGLSQRASALEETQITGLKMPLKALSFHSIVRFCRFCVQGTDYSREHPDPWSPD
jgi:hypothetical protein